MKNYFKEKEFVFFGALLNTFFLLFVFGAHVNAQPLTGIMPKYDANVHQQQVTFEWNTLDNALNYTVVLSQDPTFSVNLVSSPPLLSTSWTSGVLSWGEWYWKVQANTGSGTIESGVNRFEHFIPSLISTTSFWLSADNGVDLDANGRVLGWNDLTSSALNLNQTDPVKRPFYVPSSLNGLPTVNFQGAQWMTGGDILDLGTNSRQFFLVGNFNGTNQTFFAKSNSNSAISRYALMRFGTQSTIIYQELTDNHLLCTASSTNFSLYNWENNRQLGYNKLNLNNTSIGVKTLIPSHNFQSNFRFLLGAFNGANDVGEAFFLNGNISEVVFVDNSTVGDVSKVQKYLKHKYTPELNLGPDIAASNFCPIDLAATNSYSNILWSTGETTSTISVSEPGSYWVKGTDEFGFISYDTVVVSYPQIPLPQNTGICFGGSNTWNADMGPGYTYFWSDGLTTPSNEITNPGVYFVQVYDGTGCFRTSEYIEFSVDLYALTISLGNDTSLCSGNYLALQSGQTGTTTYLWSDGSQASQMMVNTTGDYFVETTNANQCVGRDTIHVTITGTAPIADFQVNNNCLGFASVISEQSAPIGSDVIILWRWNMGEGPLIEAQNPNYTYVNPGTYTIELYVESVGGCGAYHYDTISVYSNPNASFNFSGHCQGQTVDFVNTTTTTGGSISSYSWNFDMPWTGAYNTSTIPIPNRIFDTVGLYNVTLQVTDVNGCTDIVSMPVGIDPSPQVSFSAPIGCQSQTVQFTPNVVTQGASTYSWDFGDNTFSVLSAPAHVFDSYGWYTVQLDVENGFGCSNSEQNQALIHALPISLFDIGPYCEGTYVELTNLSNVPEGTISSTYWVVNQQDTVIGANAFYLINSQGQQQIELYTTSNFGCTATLSEFIEVNSSLDVSFTTGSLLVSAGEQIVFENTSSGTNVALWNFGDETFSADFSPTHVYDSQYQDSTVMVYLIGMNAEGCIDTAVQYITIARPLIDLEVSELFLEKTGDWFYLAARLKNVGSLTISKIDLQLVNEEGYLFNELWNGALLPEQDTIYIFNAQSVSNISYQDRGDAFICLRGIAYDWQGNKETYLENNNVCKNIEGDDLILMPIMPNPAQGEIEIGLIVSKASETYIDLVDMNGKIVQHLLPEQQLEKGTYFFDADVSTIGNGVYYILVYSDKQKITEKLLINNY